MLKSKNHSLLVLLIFSLLICFNLGIYAQEYNEAPMLKKEVQSGVLPGIEERLPANPLVIEPWNETGKYGGTWNRFGTNEEWIHFRMSMYGFSLVRWEKGGSEVKPGLLTDWESNEDKTIWTLHFRKGVKWSNGEPFDANDFLFWWKEMAVNTEHPQPVPDWAITGAERMTVDKVDDYTIKLKYSAPAPQLIYNLATYPNGGISSFDVVPSHYLKKFHPKFNDEYDDYEEFQEKQEWWLNTECPVLTAWKPVINESGSRMILERNPYYYAVDTAGNQLPYIDKVNIRFIADGEIYKLKLASGESDMQIRPGILTIRDIAYLKNKENDNNFKTLLWNSSSASGPLFYPNQNHPDVDKRNLYQNHKFLMALSHTLDRDKIRKMVYFNKGIKTVGTNLAPESIENLEYEPLKQAYKNWMNLAVEYQPDKSKELLDELGVVDQNGDGWREMPNGQELQLRIDMDSEANINYSDISEMAKEAWRSIGLKTIVNPIDGSHLTTMVQSANFDIRGSWEIGIGPHPMDVVIGEWLVPMGNARWAPLYGGWFSVRGTEKANQELDKAPRDRSPARKKPPAGSVYEKMQNLYEQAISATTAEKRDEIVTKIVNLHVKHGPFVIGTVGSYPRVGVVKNYFENVPTREQIPMGGFVNPWHMAYPAVLSPEQFYIDK